MHLISATRLDGRGLLLLPLHVDRLNDAAIQHRWNVSVDHDSLQAVCHNATTATATGPAKLRILLAIDGTLAATATPLPSLPPHPFAAASFSPPNDPAPFAPILSVHLDSLPTPSSLFTSTKTTVRAHYDAARARFPAADDVLLYNTDGDLTETTICNVAFFRGARWLTPRAESGCLPGVLRRWLLENNRISEDKGAELTNQSLSDGEWVLLFNGVQGCRLGRVVLP